MFLLSAALQAHATDLVLAGGQIWDGVAPTAIRADLWLHDDRIVGIGTGLDAPANAQRIDITGSTVVPGLIDAHVHLSMDPGATWRSDTAETREMLLEAHLRAYLASGVTTILDPAVRPVESSRIQAALSRGVPGPEYLHLGTAFSPLGGYPAVVVPGFPTVDSEIEVEAQLDEVLRQGAIGAKIAIEDGMVGPIWDVFRPELLDAIHDGAKSRHLPLYVHAMSPEEQGLALERLQPHAMVHPLDRPHAPTIKKIVEAGVFEVTTLSVYDMAYFGYDESRLAAPLWQATVPEIEKATATASDQPARYQETMIRTTLPGLPFTKAVAASRLPLSMVQTRLKRANRAIRALAKAGVPLVMGSDSGNWPIFPYLFHGPTSIREIELLGEAGLTPVEALRAATSTAARMLGREGDIGTIAPGARADLVVVEGNPLDSLAQLRSIKLTIRAGQAHTPTEWLKPEIVSPPDSRHQP